MTYKCNADAPLMQFNITNRWIAVKTVKIVRNSFRGCNLEPVDHDKKKIC